MVAASIKWNTEMRVFIPLGMAQREKDGRSIRTLIKAIIGFFIFLPTNAPRRVVLFQGLRNQYVFQLFKKDEIYIIGSWVERKFARANGYGFIPNFPVESALKLAIYRGLSFFAKMILLKWQRWIKSRDVTVFVYEDTHPLGTFMVLLTDHDTSGYRAICIQHGHFPKYKHIFYPEGRLTEYNLVFDTQQIKTISNRPDKTSVVGLNYNATASARLDGVISVIFLGLGSDTHYTKSINTFYRIAVALSDAFENIEIAYRPHPNELKDSEKIDQCKCLFGRIDRTPKVDILNGPWTLFVGEASSMLYEAKQSGHLTAFVSIDPKIIPTGYHDITICIKAIDAFVNKFRDALTYPPPLDLDRAAAGDPVSRFISALRELRFLSMMAKND